MKIKVLLLGIFCLLSFTCFAQSDLVPDGYLLPKKCAEKVQVYQGIKNKPSLSHYKYWSGKFWLIKAEEVTGENGITYVKVIIPNDDVAKDAKVTWTNDGQMVDEKDFNTWLFIKKNDLTHFKTFNIPELMVSSYYPETRLANAVH